MFEIGVKIRFKYTGLEAEIVEDHMDGSYTVWFEKEDEESIAFADDIVLAKHFKGVQESEQQKQLKKAPKQPSTEALFYSKEELLAKKRAALAPQKAPQAKQQQAMPPENSFVAPTIVPSPPSQTGCYLVFVPTTPNNYTIYLVNDYNQSFRFEFKLFLQQRLVQGFNKTIPPNTFFAIGELLQEQFNDAPSIEFSCPTFSFNKQLKLKYRKFLKTIQQVPLMGLSAHCFLLFKELHFPKQSSTSLQEYTQHYQKEKADLTAPIRQLYRSFDLMDIASFEPELDLHAEKLVNDTSEFTAKELYELQLEVLDNFIHKAIDIGLQEIFIIHGVGKGKLKQAVDQFLRFHGDVKAYKNEFHEKYGFGATKVLLKK